MNVIFLSIIFWTRIFQRLGKVSRSLGELEDSVRGYNHVSVSVSSLSNSRSYEIYALTICKKEKDLIISPYY